MTQFLKKLAFHILLVTTITGSIVLGRYLYNVRSGTVDFSTLPTHFISNSVCFNTKLEHARTSNRLIHAKTLILGSSMALNNVSGKALSAYFTGPVYNLSSWGLKPYESYEVLKQLDTKLAINRLIIPFNHTEFGADTKAIAYDGIRDYFSQTTPVDDLKNYFANFTLDGFIKDWSFRTNYIHRSNVNFSLNFDEEGSIVLQPEQFVFAKDGRRLTYQDTTGFQRFAASIDSISRFCQKRQIALTLVYLPWRPDVRTPDKTHQITYVATYLTDHYPASFVNLSGLPVARQHYADAGHMFEAGAKVVTHALLDSLTKQQSVANSLLPANKAHRVLVSR